MSDDNLDNKFDFEPSSEKLLNGNYLPRGQIIKKTNGGITKIMKTFSGEFSTKEEADIAFIRLAKEYADKNL